MKNSESHMVSGIRAGREGAFEQLFKEYYRALSVFALKYVEDIDTAKEIVQDFFVHLYESRHMIVITTSLRSYLYQSVRNRCLNLLKQQKIRSEHLDNLKYEQESSEDIEANIEETELEDRIFRIVEGLPVRCREIFTMSRVKGLTNQEIAEQLGISKRTVETQISNALKVLRERL